MMDAESEVSRVNDLGQFLGQLIMQKLLPAWNSVSTSAGVR